jgi:hypothetical protein
MKFDCKRQLADKFQMTDVKTAPPSITPSIIKITSVKTLSLTEFSAYTVHTSRHVLCHVRCPAQRDELSPLFKES